MGEAAQRKELLQEQVIVKVTVHCVCAGGQQLRLTRALQRHWVVVVEVVQAQNPCTVQCMWGLRFLRPSVKSFISPGAFDPATGNDMLNNGYRVQSGVQRRVLQRLAMESYFANHGSAFASCGPYDSRCWGEGQHTPYKFLKSCNLSSQMKPTA